MSTLTPHRMVWPLTGNNCVYCGLKSSADVHTQQPEPVKSYGAPCGLRFSSDVSTETCGECGFPKGEHVWSTGKPTFIPESPDTVMARRAIKRAIETLKWALDDLG